MFGFASSVRCGSAGPAGAAETGAGMPAALGLLAAQYRLGGEGVCRTIQADEALLPAINLWTRARFADVDHAVRSGAGAGSAAGTRTSTVTDQTMTSRSTAV